MYRTRSMSTRTDAIAPVQFRTRAPAGAETTRQREAEARRRLEQLREERQLQRNLYDVFGDEVW